MPDPAALGPEAGAAPASSVSARVATHRWMRRNGAHRIAFMMAVYLMPTTMDSGPAKCSTRIVEKPASFIQPRQSAPV